MRERIAEWIDGLDGKVWGLIPMTLIWLLFWWVPERKPKSTEEGRDES